MRASQAVVEVGDRDLARCRSLASTRDPRHAGHDSVTALAPDADRAAILAELAAQPSPSATSVERRCARPRERGPRLMHRLLARRRERSESFGDVSNRRSLSQAHLLPHRDQPESSILLDLKSEAGIGVFYGRRGCGRGGPELPQERVDGSVSRQPGCAALHHLRVVERVRHEARGRSMCTSSSRGGGMQERYGGDGFWSSNRIRSATSARASGP
jgi:hypothetical protein